MPARRQARKNTANARYTPLDADGPLPLDMIRSVPVIQRDPLEFLTQMVKQHGDLVAFPMPRAAVLLVNDPAGARHVLLDNHRGYTKHTTQYGALSAVTGQGLLTAETQPWRARRRLIQPAFHHSELPAVGACAALAGDQLRDTWLAASDQTLDVDAAAVAVMLGLVGRTLFDDELAPRGGELIEAIGEALQLIVGVSQLLLPSGWPTPGRRRLRHAVRTIDQVCAELVERRRERWSTAQSSSGGDLLGLLLQAAEAGLLTPRQVRDEIVTMIIAGHETVASALTWTLQLLADNPEAADRLEAELVAVLGDRRPTFDDAARLPWCRAVVDEALRLYPPAWLISRRAVAPDDVCGVPVPAGALIILCPWLLHRRVESWPDPLRFAPERFLGAGAPATQRGGQGGDYLPFGTGPRQCIGRDVALIELVIMLAALLRGRRVRRPAGALPPRVQALVTLRPIGGLRLTLEDRGPG